MASALLSEPVWLEFEPCGFAGTGADLRHGYDVDQAPNLKRILVRRDSIIAVIDVRTRNVSGVSCAFLLYGSQARLVIGSYDRIVRIIRGHYGESTNPARPH